MTTHGESATHSGAPAVAARTGPATAAEDPTGTPGGDLSVALAGLRAATTAARFPLDLPTAEPARRNTAALTDQLDDYLLPRLARLDAPLLVVVGGSTGAGKSTLVNSLVQARVSAAGVLRPTTRSPVLVCNPADSGWFRQGELLPGLTRTSEPSEDPRTLQLVTAPALPAGLAFLDAPDIDSVVDANRALAGQLLAAADLWLFVTTAARYADAVPWELLHNARARGAAIALVLDRVPAEATEEVSAHLAEMLATHDLGAAPLFVLPETQVDGQGLLPERVTAPLGEWFARLAADAEARAAVVRQTLDGALAALGPITETLAEAADEQATAADALDDRVRGAYRGARRTVEQGLSDGRLLRGEVLARWQEFVGTGEFFRTLEARIGRFRDRVVAAVTGRPAPANELRDAIESQLVTLLRGVAAEAAENAYTGWRAHPAGAALLDPDLAHASADLPERAERMVRDWQRGVLDLVRTEGGDKRFVARTAAYAVNATGLAVMIAVFASTAFVPTGLEVATGAGTTVAAQAVLQAIFGDQAVRNLARRARADLLERVDTLLDEEAARFLARTASARPEADTAADLRAAAARVADARERGDLDVTR
ncbi:ABC transporter [Micromonospora sp. NPDC050187]|uniref:ABC transporter n=1 Tax=Micromonospora sp. NPDC050187 TaxID=3364277 RepID=UPI003787FBEB